MKSVRLPSYLKPTEYDLILKPDLEAFVFSGKEIINITVGKEIKKITLHSKDLDIETIKITQGRISQFANKITYDLKSETVTFYFKEKIPKGKIKMSIIFSGIIKDNLRGFYKSKYEINGETKTLITTQFEATDARRAFPCFDEPVHKAIFKVRLIIPNKHTAISNTLPITCKSCSADQDMKDFNLSPIQIKEHEAGYKIISFSPTPKMSTYLLAFIVGEFEYLEGYARKNPTSENKSSNSRTKRMKSVLDHESLFSDSEFIKVRVFTTHGKKHQAKFALDVAIKSLEFYSQYFDIPYPLSTLDMIAIPDFESAAMENWGAITYRETAILVDEEHTSLSNKQWIAIVIAHEIAHQWFGNLVTMHWWTDLWLNEGFASYMENFCVDKMFPHWHIWDKYLADRHGLALSLDSLANSHPIEIEVHHPNEISEIFDTVSYAKGSAIIRMLAEYLGEDKFRDGLRYYLKKHSYKNTKTLDLWTAFEKVSKKPIKKIMNSWTKQTGYPLVSVSSPNARGLKSQTPYVWLQQERFFSSRISKKKNKEKNIWQIPINYNDEKILLVQKDQKIKEKVIGKINKNEKSFFRVKYNEKSLNFIKKEIKENRLSIADRLGTIRDLFALAEGGYIKSSLALEFSLNYKKEEEYIIWAEIAYNINHIYNLFSNQKLISSYKKYALSLFSPLAKKIGFYSKGNEKHSIVFLRNLAISQAGYFGDKKIIKKAQEIFLARIKKPIKADLRGIIYKIVAENGKEKEWQSFQKLYLQEKMQEEKDRITKALASFKNKDLLKKTLNFAFSKNVRPQDAPFLIGAVWQNIHGREITWQFVKNNWTTILKNYGEGGHLISRLLSPLGNHIKKEDAIKAKKFFNQNPAPGAERTLKQCYEKIYSNSAWFSSDKKDIQNWLEKNF